MYLSENEEEMAVYANPVALLHFHLRPGKFLHRHSEKRHSADNVTSKPDCLNYFLSVFIRNNPALRGITDYQRIRLELNRLFKAGYHWNFPSKAKHIPHNFSCLTRINYPNDLLTPVPDEHISGFVTNIMQGARSKDYKS